GNVAHVKEVTREMWGAVWIDRLMQDLRYALRSLRRARGFATVAILTLGLGIGANTALFTVVNGVLLRHLPFAEPDRLFDVSCLDVNNPWMPEPTLVDAHYLDFKARTHAFETVATYFGGPVTLTEAGEPARLHSAWMTPELTRVLGVAPALGTAF